MTINSFDSGTNSGSIKCTATWDSTSASKNFDMVGLGMAENSEDLGTSAGNAAIITCQARKCSFHNNQEYFVFLEQVILFLLSASTHIPRCLRLNRWYCLLHKKLL